MTAQHGDRANGDSYFTVEDLKLILDQLCHGFHRTHNHIHCGKIKLAIIRVEKEIEYIKSIKSREHICQKET